MREITSHGLAGQLGVAAGATAPTSTTLAEAAAGSASATSRAARRVLVMPAFNTSRRQRLWWSARNALHRR